MATANKLVVLKVQREDNSNELRRISFNSEQNFSELKDILKRVYHDEVKIADLKIKYIDDDGDWVSIDSDIELVEAIKIALTTPAHTLRLRISISTFENKGKQRVSEDEINHENQEHITPFTIEEIQTLLRYVAPNLANIDLNSPKIRPYLESLLEQNGHTNLDQIIHQLIPFLHQLLGFQFPQGSEGESATPTTSANSNSDVNQETQESYIPCQGQGICRPVWGSCGGPNMWQQWREQKAERRAEILKQLEEMGFWDQEVNWQTFQATSGDFDATVQRLVSVYN